jgi:hypothetical protein
MSFISSEKVLPSQEALSPSRQIDHDLERACLFPKSPSTHDIIDAIHQGYTILIEGNNLKNELKALESRPGDLCLSLSTITAYLIDIGSIIDDFLLHKTNLHPVLCEQILTSTHEVVTNAILWSNLEVDQPHNQSKSLDFCDLIKERLKNKTLAKRLLKINLHLNPKSVEVVVTSSGKGFDWNHTVSNISRNYQGVAIIHSFADEVVSDQGGKILSLKFYY